MPDNEIKIQDILIQGNMGQRLKSFIYSSLDPQSCSKEELYQTFSSGNRVIRHEDSFYLVNPDITPAVQNIDLDLMDENDQTLFMTATKNSVNTKHMEQVLIKLKLLPAPENVMHSTVEFINAIAQLANTHKPQAGEITRLITDEFSFYPKERPFTLDEYKELIKQVSTIAQSLPPDIHLVLATFPVIWPDGVIDNCGLYVQSPRQKNDKAIIHHFYKENNSNEDIEYYIDTKNKYPLRSSKNHYKETSLSPASVLSDTETSQNDVNQFRSALKIVTSDETEMLVTLGICFDHSQGVERTAAHGLIEQLKSKGQSVPLHCSHVITSASIGTQHKHLLSTITHADPNPFYRAPKRSGFTESSISSSFSGQVSAEIYPPKAMGFIHSDLFQHAVANEPLVELIPKLNHQDAGGNTPLHQVFSETIYDRELIARRLYSMIIHGGDPDIKNLDNISARDLAREIELSEATDLISRAIDSAIEWRDYTQALNTISSNDQQLPFTRLLTDLKWDSKPEDIISTMIQQGANPYQKDERGQNAIEIIQHYADENLKHKCLATIKQSLVSVQYGYFRPGQEQPEIPTPHALPLPPSQETNDDSIKPEIINKKSRIQKEAVLITNKPSWFLPLVPKTLAVFNLPSLQEKVDQYLILIEKIKSNHFAINELYPAVNYLVKEIESLFGEGAFNASNYKIATDTVMQIIEDRFSLAKQFKPSPDLMMTSPSTNRTLSSFVFEQLNKNLNSKINCYEDLKFIRYLQADEKNRVLQLVNQKISNPDDPLKQDLCTKINTITDLDRIQELSLESLSAIFEQIKQSGKKIKLPESFNDDDELINQHALIHLINNNRVLCVNLLPQLLDIVEPNVALDTKALIQELNGINLKRAPNVITHLADVLNNINEHDALSQRKEIQGILGKLTKKDYSAVVEKLNPALQRAANKSDTNTQLYKQQINEMRPALSSLTNPGESNELTPNPVIPGTPNSTL